MYNFVKSSIFQKTNTISNRVIFPNANMNSSAKKITKSTISDVRMIGFVIEKEAEVEVLVVNRNKLHGGNTAVVKDLPIKCTPERLKADTKIKNIAPHFLTWENLPHTFFELALD